ncbi:potassium-transporting ATPase subunit F [Paenibacillus albicereus]|uniref:Potassium-transporting ATPase subunit F n=1 Tax=Paenibacillus albicereus TaxID=2726185 RepID=A0A6H2GWB7_9BACL|nr:potassium-transporting ATPase subunit F [Paenibacillus albicereus]
MRQRDAGRKRKTMIALLWTLVAAVFLYLVYVLLHPDQF